MDGGSGLWITAAFLAGMPRLTISPRTPSDTAMARVARAPVMPARMMARREPVASELMAAAAWKLGKNFAGLSARLRASAVTRLANSGPENTASGRSLR